MTGQYRVRVERDVQVAMSDGVSLSTDIFLPEADEKVPVLLRRTPYGTSKFNDTGARLLASRGFIVVVQDVRGRFGSGGEWHWMHRPDDETMDSQDGLDTVSWVKSLSGGRGEIGLFGYSYDAWAAWQYALDSEQDVTSILSGGMTGSHLDFTDGLFETGRRLEWTYMMAVDARNRLGDSTGPTDPEEAHLLWHRDLRDRWIWSLPLVEIPEPVFGPLTNSLHRLMAHSHHEMFSFPSKYHQRPIDALQLTGWWDRFNRSVRNHALLETNGKGKHWLIVGPWAHDPQTFRGRLGDYQIPPNASADFYQIVSLWFRHQLQEENPKFSSLAPVQLYIIGMDRWFEAETWPPKPDRLVSLFLRIEHPSKSSRNHLLTSVEERKGVSSSVGFTYDPLNPAPSIMNRSSQVEPLNQRHMSYRDDIVRFDTELLEEDVLVIGEPRVLLWLASDAPDTDWSVRLIDVDPSGYEYEVSYAQVRTSLLGRTNLQDEQEYAIDLRPVGCCFLRGHRIRLAISSSDFPRFDRNHNTGANYWTDPETRRAHQQVFADAARCSRIDLPVFSAESDAIAPSELALVLA